MLPLLIILLPFVAAVGLMIFRPEGANVPARWTALIVSLACLLMVIVLIARADADVLTIALDRDWINAWGLRFVLGYDGISLLMLFLTALIFPFIVGAGFTQRLPNTPLVNALLLFTQSMLFGVFLAQNAFLFYGFYELALVPVFFLLLYWGGERRRIITLKFFIYTVFGSLVLLFGLIYCYLQTPEPHGAELSLLGQLRLPADTQTWLFWALFLAFAIKMPMFPFHSWQPDTYTMAPLQGTMVLAGVMLKMGLYGAVRFVLPIVPDGVEQWRTTIIALSLIGMLYASVIAFRQRDLKRLIAWSSLGHVGLLCAGLFAVNAYGVNGALYQALAHAVIVVALLYLAGGVEQRTGTMEMSAMGGMKLKTPRLAALFLLVMLASLALPLTQGFVGEWLMFNGLFERSPEWAAVGIVSIVLGAIYMLYAYQRVMLGPDRWQLGEMADAGVAEHWVVVPLIAITLVLGVYPAPVLGLLEGSVQSLLNITPALMP